MNRFFHKVISENSPDQLEQLLSTEIGKQLLSQDGDPAAIKILSTTQSGGAVIASFLDPKSVLETSHLMLSARSVIAIEAMFNRGLNKVGRFQSTRPLPSHLSTPNLLFLWASFSGHRRLHYRCEAYLAEWQSHVLI